MRPHLAFICTYLLNFFLDQHSSRASSPSECSLALLRLEGRPQQLAAPGPPGPRVLCAPWPRGLCSARCREGVSHTASPAAQDGAAQARALVERRRHRPDGRASEAVTASGRPHLTRAQSVTVACDRHRLDRLTCGSACEVTCHHPVWPRRTAGPRRLVFLPWTTYITKVTLQGGWFKESGFK